MEYKANASQLVIQDDSNDGHQAKGPLTHPYNHASLIASIERICASDGHASSAGEVRIENCPPQSEKFSIFPRIAVLSMRVGCWTSSVVASPV